MIGWRAAASWIAAGAGIASAQQPLAGVPGVTITHYDVEGRGAAAVRAAIDRARPTDPNDGTRVDALTRYHYRWRWPIRGDGSCDLGAVAVAFEATVLLPALAATAELSTAERERWSRYIVALERHEAGHVANGAAIRGALTEAIRTATCSTADAAAHRVIGEAVAADVAYDRRTRHGQTDGSAFP